jgi:hypothetical protein
MKRRTIAALTATVAALGLTLGLSIAASATTARPAATAKQAVTATTPGNVVLNCGSKPVVAPTTFIITCADAGIGVQDLHWTSWTPKLASGYGTFWENDCIPNCAAGHFHYYPSLEVLWGSATVKGLPSDQRYTELTVIFTGKTRPPVYVSENGKLVATYPLTQTFDAA